MNEKIKYLAQLPDCPVRFGRFNGKKAVMCCGQGEVKAEECVKCGGLKLKFKR